MLIIHRYILEQNMPHLGQSASDAAADESKRKADEEYAAQQVNRNNEPKSNQVTQPQNDYNLSNPTPARDPRELLHPDKVVSYDSQTVPQVEQDRIVSPGNIAAEVQRQDSSLNRVPTLPIKTQPTGAVEEAKQHFFVNPITEGHRVTITPEVGLHHNFKAVCDCAWQGVFKTKEEAIERATKHKAIRTKSPF